MRTRTSACVVLAVSALASSPSATAEARATTSISWVRLPGAEGCIDARALALAVERRLGGQALATPARAARSIEGRVEIAHDGAGDAGFRATFTLAGQDGAVLGTREIGTASADCRAMDEDLALVAALLIDPDAAVAPQPRAATVHSPAAALPNDEHEMPPPEMEPPPPRWSAEVRGGPAFSLGFLPSVGTGVTVRAGVTPPRFVALEIGGVVWAQQRATGADGSIGADMWIAYGTLSICPLATEWRGFVGAACAGLEVGAVHAGGFGFATAHARDVAIANGAVAARVRRTIAGPFFGGVGLGLSVPFVRPDLYYRQNGTDREAFAASPVAGTLELALGLDLR